MAGQFAKQIEAKKLILTHFRFKSVSEITTNLFFFSSMRYQGVSENESLTVDDLVKESQVECPNTQVFAAEDFKKFDI